MVDDLGETDPGEFFVQLGMLILESRQPFISVKGRQDGPHCPKDVGMWSGHVCGSTSLQCIKTNQILKQMQTMWRNQVPLCVEVLILPSCPHGQLRSVSTDVTPPYEDDSYVLLEQWTIQSVQKKPGETIVSPKNLFQALKSYLHFSQLSSWLSSSQGKRPSCIGYRVSPPAEFCTTTFNQDPQLHVFPVGNVSKSTNFKVWLAYLSRMPEIPEPICHEISESGHPCFSSHASKSLSKGPLNKKGMSRSKSPRPRFEAVFQNITGSPKLVSKSCSSTLSKQQRLPVQQCQLGSILKAPMLQSVTEAAFKNCFLNDAVLPSEWKDDAYGIGFNDSKSQCEVKIGHMASVRGGVSMKTLPLLTAGIETGMRNLKLTSEFSDRHQSLEDRYWSATCPSFYDEPNESDKESIGNCYFDREVDISLPRNLQSKHCSMSSRKLPYNSNRELELINRSLSPDFSRIKKSSLPINIAAKGGELGMNYAQMLLKDQSVTDSENSCSPDFDLLLNETLVNMAEPMNPEEMYERLSRLCKKKHQGSKCSVARDVTWQQSCLESSKMNATTFRDEIRARVENSDLDDSSKKRLPSEDNDKHKPVISGNPSKYKCVCDNNRAGLASPECMKSECRSCFASIPGESFDREGLNKRELSSSEATEFLDSLKHQNSTKRQKKEQRLEEELASSLETDEQRPVFSVGDEAGDNQLWHTSTDAFTSAQFERSHQSETQEYNCNFLKSNDYRIHEEKPRAANLLKSYSFQSNRPQQKHDDTDNVHGGSYLPPSTLHLRKENQPPSEVTPLRPLSAIPRRLQSKTPQESRHPSMLFGDPKSLLQQKSPDTNISTKSDKGPAVEDSNSNGNGYQQSSPRVPTEVEKKGFRVRVQHSSSMVFNSRTKLPMQSSPVPAKRLSAGCFDYDSSLNSVQAIKNSLSCNNLDDAENNSDGCNRLKQAFSSSAPASTNCLLGNFEESLINGRIQPAGVIDGFTVEIGASGSFCPSHLTLPCLAFFFSLSEDSAPSPYLGHINLESHSKRGYKVPNKGTVQVTLFNPNKSVVKIFVVTYDVSDMPPNHQTLLRQKTVYMPTPGSPSDVPGAPVYLRYLIHLRFASSKQCKIYVHTDIRLIFARDRFELDNRIYHYELRSFTEAPENPKYSPKR